MDKVSHRTVSTNHNLFEAKKESRGAFTRVKTFTELQWSAQKDSHDGMCRVCDNNGSQRKGAGLTGTERSVEK